MVFLDMNELTQRAREVGASKVLLTKKVNADQGEEGTDQDIQFTSYYLRKGVAWLPFKKTLRGFIFNGRYTWDDQDDEATAGLWLQIVYSDRYDNVLCFLNSVKDVTGSDLQLENDDVLMVTFADTIEQILNMSKSKANSLRCRAFLFKKGVLDKEWSFTSGVVGLRGILREAVRDDDDDEDEDEVIGRSGRDGSEFHCRREDCAYCSNEDCDLNYYYDW